MKKIPAILSVIILAACCLFLLLRQREYVEEPPYIFSAEWLGKGNLWVFDQPPVDYLKTLSATGTIFSVYYSGFNEYEWEYVKNMHRHGFKVIANLPLGQSTITENLSLREAAAKRDIHNNPILLLGLEGLYNMCGNHPLWREFLAKRIAEQARGGVDGVLLDEPGDLGDCFCEYCMTAFNHYLGEHYSPDQLQSLGINDLTSFNYRQYLLERGGSHWWDDHNPQLQIAYLRFRYSKRAELIQELIKRAREASGWEIPITANLYGLDPNQQIFSPLLDFLGFEIPITSETNPNDPSLRPTPGKCLTIYLLSEAIDPHKPYSAFPDVFELQRLSEDEWWLWRHWLAEARACRCSFLIPYQAYVYGGERSYTIPAEKLSPYIHFFSTHRQFYENVKRIATVGLLYDLHSTLVNTYPWLTWDAWWSFKNLGTHLQEAHIPFEVVYKGDGTFVQKSLTLDELLRYRAVVVPKNYNLDQPTMDILKQYSMSGGFVLWRDNFPDDSHLLSALHSLGIDLGLETNAGDDLGLIAYRGNGSLVIHLINYRYSKALKDFSDLTDIDVTLEVPADVNLEGKQLKLFSPDVDAVTLDFTVQSGKVTFKIPSLHCYSVASWE